MTPGETAAKPESNERARPAETPLEQVVEEIRGDAARAPEQYAREAIVAEGGE